MTPWAIHCFKKDLRVTGNRALTELCLRSSGKVLGLVCLPPKASLGVLGNGFAFYLETIAQLERELSAMGSELLVVGADRKASLQMIFGHCRKASIPLPTLVSWNRDYEPSQRQEEDETLSYLNENGIEVLTSRDHLLIEPHEILNQQGKPYQVYTAFAKRWFELFATPEIQQRLEFQALPPRPFKLTWGSLFHNNPFADRFNEGFESLRPPVTIAMPPAGFSAALDFGNSFRSAISDYATERDFPATNGTSKLGRFLANGSITAAQLISFFDLGQSGFKSQSGPGKYLHELVWREFYYHLLWHSPRVAKEAFQTRYKDLIWDNDDALFSAWTTGNTGFPIVDAGMRELLTTGWMHNRLRMIVASFLTKDLLIDWQWGERWFTQHLLDADLACNNGGWQWAASTGCDAQPYFRIFNPASQSKRFDPKGTYIRKFVPELARLSEKDIHCPSAEQRKSCGYPAPVVDHARQRVRAMKLYQK